MTKFTTIEGENTRTIVASAAVQSRVNPSKETNVAAQQQQQKSAKVEKVEKEKKAKRKNHPLIGNKDAKVYPFASMPEDYDPKVHNRLKRKDFAEEGAFFDFRALEFDQKAAEMRQKAEEARATGGAENRGQAKRLQKMVSKVEQLKKELASEGIDVEKLIQAALASQKGEGTQAAA